MNKYIDAEKLIAEIERLKEETPIGICEYDKGEENGRMEVLTSLQSTIDYLQQEQPMPNSTQLIELWHQDKEMLKEKDFRNDPWRLAYNAFMCGFGRGLAVNKQEQPEVDLEKELDSLITPELKKYKALPSMMDVAKHFYELGLNARKEEKK